MPPTRLRNSHNMPRDRPRGGTCIQSTSKYAWSPSHETDANGIRALGRALPKEKDMTRPALKGKLRYYQGEVTFTTKAPRKPRTACTSPLDTLAVSTVNVHKFLAWAAEKNDQTLLLALSYIVGTLPRPPCFQDVSRAPPGTRPQPYVSRAFSRHDIRIINDISLEAPKEAFDFPL